MPLWRYRQRPEELQPDRVPETLGASTGSGTDAGERPARHPVSGRSRAEEAFDGGPTAGEPIEPAVAGPGSRSGGAGRAASVAGMSWAELREAVAACTACTLHQRRKQAVLGVGDERADWLIVGEGPGAEEDARGEPFVGPAGKLLDNMLGAIGLKRGANVYIANVVKCRPPGNRTPSPEEADACAPFLDRQIELLQPRLIIALGKAAAHRLLGNDGTLASMRATVHRYRGIPLVVTYHPAYLLRNLADKSKAWEDLCFAVDTMSGLLQDEDGQG